MKLLTAKQRYWLDHIQAAEASGEGLAEYSRARGLVAKRLYVWRTLLMQKGYLEAKRRSSGFASVEVLDRVVDDREDSVGAEIRFGNGVAIKVRELSTELLLRLQAL